MRYPTHIVKRPKEFDGSNWQSFQTPPFCNWSEHVADVPAILTLDLPGSEGRRGPALCAECAEYLAESLLMDLSILWKGIEIGQPDTTGDHGFVLKEAKSGRDPMRVIWLRRPRRGGPSRLP